MASRLSLPLVVALAPSSAEANASEATAPADVTGRAAVCGVGGEARCAQGDQECTRLGKEAHATSVDRL